ncbi:MAG: DUF309 domain-containing protein [Candidatus Marinimicrobia bacterium]|nr:DUF309 domain-containing protein [Candidatus Neomarinimicrobiota bacterium]MCF7902656.1 DUF309 domain-containing protein [Candidatus Neomarinimicrobiota bacterium]
MTPDQINQFKRGLDLFNSGEFYDCHEVLEALWEDLLGNEKRIVQGVLQIAVGFYHLRTGNLNGARSQLRKAAGKFETFPTPPDFPLDIPTLGAELNQIRNRLSAVDEPVPDVVNLPAPQLRLCI